MIVSLELVSLRLRFLRTQLRVRTGVRDTGEGAVLGGVLAYCSAASGSILGVSKNCSDFLTSQSFIGCSTA